MALGKRKRRDQIGSEDSSTYIGAEDTTEDLQSFFRKHFEAQFKPLKCAFLPIKAAQVPTPPSEESNSEWEGLSDDDGHEGPVLVGHDVSHQADNAFNKNELKAFMARTFSRTAKPPTSRLASSSKSKEAEPPDPEEIASDAANLRKDLALQRLLKESHLLEPQSELAVSGRNRHKALDMRLQDLGSKTSLYTQAKMPMSHRKGIAAKLAKKEDTRRREAKETGTILEKAVKAKKAGEARRQRSIGAPTVGKFQGGMLKLSKQDVADIQGPKPKSVKKRR